MEGLTNATEYQRQNNPIYCPQLELFSYGMVRGALMLEIALQHAHGLFEEVKEVLDARSEHLSSPYKEEINQYYVEVAEVLQGQIDALINNGGMNYTVLAKRMNNLGWKSRFYKDFTYASMRMLVLKLKREGKIIWSEK